jgi:hypothetical protein
MVSDGGAVDAACITGVADCSAVLGGRGGRESVRFRIGYGARGFGGGLVDVGAQFQGGGSGRGVGFSRCRYAVERIGRSVRWGPCARMQRLQTAGRVKDNAEMASERWAKRSGTRLRINLWDEFKDSGRG